MPTQQQIDAALAAQAQQNLAFMRYSYESFVEANAQNGTAYAIGGPSLNFDVPITPGAYLTRLIIRPHLTVTYTPDATPTFNMTAAGLFALFSNMTLTFGNKQMELPPYIADVLNKMTGYNRQGSNGSFGDSNPDIQGMLAKNFTLSAGANDVLFDIDLPLNMLHPLSVNGILPISGTGTRVQLRLDPAINWIGKDPLQNVCDTNGTIAVTGNVEVICVYRDWQSTATRQQLIPNLGGLSTVQVIKPQNISPLTAGTMNFRRITNPYPFLKLINIVIDGQQSGKFVSSASNIVGYEVDKAENTSSAFYRYDPTNGSMSNYYKAVREVYGQDFDSGLLFFDAIGRNTANSSNQDGAAYLDLTANNYPAARQGFQVNTVGNPAATQITPRVETWGIILNPVGIQAV